MTTQLLTLSLYGAASGNCLRLEAQEVELLNLCSKLLMSPQNIGEKMGQRTRADCIQFKAKLKVKPIFKICDE